VAFLVAHAPRLSLIDPRILTCGQSNGLLLRFVTRQKNGANEACWRSIITHGDQSHRKSG
jgi:hypothetical protein